MFEKSSKFLERIFYKAASDDWLVERVAEYADETAFEEIHNRYEKRIIGFIRRYLTKSDIIDDIKQHCFARLWQYPKAFGGKKLSTYFFSIAVNYHKEIYCSDKTIPISEVEENNLSLRLDSDKGIEEKIRSKQFNVWLKKTLEDGNINTDYKQISYMYYFEDMKPKEIAEVLSFPVKRVTNIIEIVKKILIEEYSKQYKES